jgi:hypothetical protein
MAPKEPRDKEQIGRVGEPGLFLVSDRTRSSEWESLPRKERRPRDRLGPLKPWKAKHRSGRQLT